MYCMTGLCAVPSCLPLCYTAVKVARLNFDHVYAHMGVAQTCDIGAV